MKYVSMKHVFFFVLISTALFTACTKDSNKPDLPSQQYILYNYSQGSPVEAGTFTIQQQADSTASLTIQLTSGFYVPSVSMPAAIVNADSVSGVDFVYANLNPVDGNNGLSVTSPVKMTNNLAVTYSDLISKKGYRVRVMNGSNVQAMGTLQ